MPTLGPTDRLVPQASGIRAMILSFLPATDIIAAGDINQAWFEGAASWSAWQPKFAANEFTAPTLEGGAEYSFPIPRMYEMTINAIGPSVADHFRKSLMSASFYDNIGQIIGQASLRHALLYPVAEIMMRHPKVLAMPIDDPVRDGYVAAPRWELIVANVARWHFVDPREADIPWALSLYDGLLTATRHYTKTLTAAAVYAMKPKTKPSVLNEDDLQMILTITTRALERHLGDLKDQSSWTGAASKLKDTDPRQLYSIFYWVQKYFPTMSAKVDEHVRLHHGEMGVSEMRSAKERVELLLREEEQRKIDRKKEIRRNMNKLREEHGLPPLPEDGS